MSLPPFNLLRPRSLPEALDALSSHHGEAMILAGGTDIVPNMQMRLVQAPWVVDIKRLSDLKGIERSGDGGLTVGALTTVACVASDPGLIRDFPVLAHAAASVAGPQLRNMGTVGGNLCLDTRCRWYNQSEFWRQSLGGCLKAEGQVCHVAPAGRLCWAAWSGDLAPAFLTLDAEVEIAGPSGTRRMPLDQLYKNDGMDRLDLAPDEVLARVHVPAGMAGYRGRYDKLRVRGSIDYPLAGVATVARLEGGVVADARVAITAVNPAPLRIDAARSLLAGHPVSEERIRRVAGAAATVGKPLTTAPASTPSYRREMLRVFTRRALRDLLSP